jgi:phospholipase/carboxylesterase
MSRSLLVRRKVAPETEPPRGIVIALHGDNGALDDLVPFARSLSPRLELVAVEAPRRVFNHQAIAHTWFSIQEPARPEAVSFGDSLFQLEQLVYDILEERGDQRAPLYLAGYDQGALMALSLGLVVPDYLSGIVSICGSLPRIAMWPLPERLLDGLPALLVYDPEDGELPAKLVEETASELAKRGGVPTLRAVSRARELDSRVLAEVIDWLPVSVK